MTTKYYIDTATLILAYCQARILWFPNAGDTTLLAWSADFEESKLSREDLLAGIAHAYKTTEGEFKPGPVDVIRAARIARAKTLEALTNAQRNLMNEANYILQDMNFTPNQATRISQAWALDQGSPIPMDAEQYAEFLRRVEVSKQELKNRAPRELESIWNVMREWDPSPMQGRRRRRDKEADDEPRRAFGAPETINNSEPDNETQAAA